MTQTTKTRYFDWRGEELFPHNMLPDMSNVHSVIRTQKMTVEQYERLLRHD